ncbi:transposase [Mucilaginibacter paludis]|uniref:Uncharacterized protein n=1 Tax=Mucilaginibacter paludis DSM 18603 TaxID=714943 RepID=H1YBV8_9SPHI|nr:transposase [Mucilaginibacter paludis]EHQ27036.1 hypothetical protein Mucpa_2928 [Mucilaginibacter paludis DSM 18603]
MSALEAAEEAKTKIVLTRKIQLLLNIKDQEAQNKAFELLCQWQRTCRRAANLILSELYMQDRLKDMIYLTEDIKIKLTNVAKDPSGILRTSKKNSTYQMLSQKFKGEMPMSILSALNNNLCGTYQKERMGYNLGTRSLRNYKREIPMPIAAKDFRHFAKIPKGRNYTFDIFGIPFKTYLGREKNFDKSALMDGLLDNKVKLCTSSMKMQAGKIFWMATFSYEKKLTVTDSDEVAEATLTIDTPIVVTIGKYRYEIGNKEEFMYRRIAIQNSLSRTQKGTSSSRGGRGRKRKMKATHKFQALESNYINSRIHFYSRKLIDLCVKHQAASLVLVNVEEAQEGTKQDECLLHNWSWYNLKDKITYKGNLKGITVTAR